MLGTVFDAKSFGNGTYNGAEYTHGPSTAISNLAGELWLLMIQLAGKIKR